MVENKDDLLLEETDEGFFVNGIEVSEETFDMLLEDLADNEDIDIEFEDEEECDCEFCTDVNFIVDFIKNEDREDAIELLIDTLNDYYTYGRQDALEDIADYCDEELDEISEELE